jgi:RNA polymerase sigma factor (TIGR02999 family)
MRALVAVPTLFGADVIEVAWNRRYYLTAETNGAFLPQPEGESMAERDAGSGAATELLLAWSEGNREALDQMMPLVYDELHRLAERYLATERPGHTLQPTALVHETYLRLINQRKVDWRNRAQFLGVAASMMRRILVNYARDRSAGKRAHGLQQVSLSLVDEALEAPDVDLIALEDAMGRLNALDTRKARVVELKFFGGLTMDEIAEVLDISRTTAEREWSFARAWLFDALEGHPGGR